MEAGKSADVQARALLDAERMLEQRARLESIEQHESRTGAENVIFWFAEASSFRAGRKQTVLLSRIVTI